VFVNSRDLNQTPKDLPTSPLKLIFSTVKMPPAKGRKAVATTEKTIEPPPNVELGTPPGGPQKQQPSITVAQKQALIDNLQLESQ
jgi:hypothetical protein